MEILGIIFGWLIILSVVSVPAGWIWVGYHKIKCWKKDRCDNKKCSFYNVCEHTEGVRKKEIMQEIVRKIKR